jgi:hypothetical protein
MGAAAIERALSIVTLGVDITGCWKLEAFINISTHLSSSFESRLTDTLSRSILTDTVSVGIASRLTTRVSSNCSSDLVSLREPNNLLSATVCDKVARDRNADDVDVRQGTFSTLVVCDRLVESETMYVSFNVESMSGHGLDDTCRNASVFLLVVSNLDSGILLNVW